MPLYCRKYGIGSHRSLSWKCYIFGSVNALNLHAELVAKLGLPEGFVPVSALAVGKAASPVQERTFTKKIETNYID